MAQQGESEPNRTRSDVDRRNPPASVVNRHIRSLALRVYLGGILALFAIVWVGLFLSGPRDAEPDVVETEAVDPQPDPSVLLRAQRPGGFDPGYRPHTTTEEFEQRGVGESIAGPMPPLVAIPPITSLTEIVEGSPANLAGRRLELESVEVETHEGDTLWVRDDHARMAIVTPASLPAIEPGTRVEVGGLVEETTHEAVRVRATRVDVIAQTEEG